MLLIQLNVTWTMSDTGTCTFFCHRDVLILNVSEKKEPKITRLFFINHKWSLNRIIYSEHLMRTEETEERDHLNESCMLTRTAHFSRAF